jgi:hypothetical protein
MAIRERPVKMSNETILRAKVRELVRAGKLPNRRPDRVWGGAAFAERECMLCGASVKQDELALELEFTRDNDGGVTNPCLHVRCFSILDGELRNRQAAGPVGRRGDPTQPANPVLPSAGLQA